MKATYFKSTEDGQFHNIDEAGNHFINGKCANPIHNKGNIGDTYPKEFIVQP